MTSTTPPPPLMQTPQYFKTRVYYRNNVAVNEHYDYVNVNKEFVTSLVFDIHITFVFWPH